MSKVFKVLRDKNEGIGKMSMLIIDPQVDFHPNGSLAISTANEDAERIANYIENHIDDISQINITLDSHQRYHIAHSIFWTNSDGESPNPFTLISEQDIKNGLWKPRDSSLQEFVLHYTNTLEASGRFVLCIWPDHCIMGTPGHAIVPRINEAIQKWIKVHRKAVNYVFKGTNCFTEHYSALQADVEIPDDATTGLNRKLIDTLLLADKVVICGQALSHCVNFTTRDLVKYWPVDKRAQLVILKDCASSVPGFESKGEDFLKDMEEQGLTIETST